MAEEGLLHLCRANEVTNDAPCRVEIDGFAYAVFQVGERYYVTADECTHGPGFLSEGAVIGSEIECPFHQGRFDIATGVPTLPPCIDPVRTWTVQFRDGDICIDPKEMR